MKNKLDAHVTAYKSGNLYDFDNEILLTWYPQRIVMNSKDAKSVLELGLGHGLTTNIFSSIFERHVVLEGSPAVIRNFKEKFPECRAKIVETNFEEFDTEEKFDVIVMGFVLEHVDDPFAITRAGSGDGSKIEGGASVRTEGCDIALSCSAFFNAS